MPLGPHDGLQLLARALRAAVLGSAVAVALLGALTGPPLVTAAGAFLGGGVAVAALRLATWGLQRDRPSPRSVALTGTTGALVVPAVLGLTLLGSAGTVLLTALLLVGRARPAGRSLSRAGSPSPPGAAAGARRP